MKPISLCLFVLSVLSSTTLLGQPAEQKKSGDRFPGGGGYVPRVGGGFERVFGILTEEQRGSFRKAMEGQREAVRNLEQKSAEARRELLEAAVVDKFDEARVKEKLTALTAIDADLTMIRIKALSKMEPALTAQQIEKLRNPGQPDGAGGPESRKRRPDVPRDENGLPRKSSP